MGGGEHKDDPLPPYKTAEEVVGAGGGGRWGPNFHNFLMIYNTCGPKTSP